VRRAAGQHASLLPERASLGAEMTGSRGWDFGTGEPWQGKSSYTTMWCMVAGEAGHHRAGAEAVDAAVGQGQVAQMRRGVLPYCVLAMLQDGERYGFELVQALGAVGGMVTSQGTIYPLLARLRRQCLVGTSWRESGAGPPRRYYHLTAAGQAALAGFSRDWAQLRDGVDALLTGGSHTGTKDTP
jgi:PadR family transcriptional regulator PadR